MLNCINPLVKKLGYFGWTGMGNLGDEALLVAVRKLLYPIVIIDHLGSYGIRKFIQNILEEYFFSGMLMGAGTLINAPGYLKEMTKLQHRKIRTFILGAGVLDPEIDSKFRKWPNCMKAWVEVLNKCEHVSVRGPLSQKILYEYGYKKAEICGDPAFIFSEENIRTIKRRKVIGLNIGTTFKGTSLWGNSDESVINFAKNLCKILVSKGYKIILFPVWTKDNYSNNKIAESVGNNIEIFDSKCDYSLFMDKVKQVDLFIGEKLHSVVLSLCTYTPSIMLSYAPKCEDVMSSIGLMDYSIRTDKLKTEKVLFLIENIRNDIEGYQNKLFPILNGYKSKLKENAGKLKLLF